MKIIAGLGNPGSRYAATRHNMGFMVLDRLAAALGASFGKKECSALTAAANHQGERILLLKPQTFMNLSGQALVAATNFYKVDWQDVLVVFDDMDLPPGQIRLRARGASGGHRGMGSILELSGRQDIPRLKVGVGHSIWPDAADYVLAQLGREDFALLDPALDRACEAALCWCREGMSRAMALYNAAPKEPKEEKQEKQTEENG